MPDPQANPMQAPQPQPGMQPTQPGAQPQQQQQGQGQHPAADPLSMMKAMHQAMPARIREKYGPLLDQVLANKESKVKGYSEDVRKGSIQLGKVPASDRGSVEQYMKQNNWNIPKPIPAQIDKSLSDARDTMMKVDSWMNYIETFRDPKTGKLPDKRWDEFWAGMKYKFGGDDPLAAMVSDFSRERWAAVAPLLHGVRRGDILFDMVQHTPNVLPQLSPFHPIPDSLPLIKTKLERLKRSFEIARIAALKEHGYDLDPVSGDRLPDQVPMFPADTEQQSAGVAGGVTEYVRDPKTKKLVPKQ